MPKIFMIAIKLAAKLLLIIIVLSAMTAYAANNNAKRETKPDAESQGGIVQGDIGVKLDTYLSRAEASGYSGVVLVAKGRRIVLQKGYGFSDRDRGILFTASTRFPLSSIDKTFTAAAILKLEQQGKLKTTDSIAAYFDRVPEDKKSITIHHLLTHSAGLPTYSGPDGEFISRDTLVQRMMDVKLQSAPGAKYSYSNPSFSLLAVIVEKVSGQSFEAFVQNQLFRPAGMKQTSYEITNRDRAMLPCSYSSWHIECKPVNSVPRLPDGGRNWNVLGSAGLWTTALDLYRWHLALKSEAVLSAESKRKAVAPYIKTSSSGTNSYGYGWFVTTTPRGTQLVHHSGGDQIVAANFRRFPDENVVIIEFTNYAWGPYRRVREEINKIAFEAEPALLPTPRVKLNRSSLQSLAGTYQLPSGEKFTVAVKNNQLIVPLDVPGAAKLFTRFAVPENPDISRDIDAKISRLLDGFARDDFEPLRELQWSELKFDEERKFWADTWRQWTKKHGAFKGAERIGAIAGTNSTAPGVKLLDTYVLVHFERGREILNFQQNPEGRFFIGYNSTYLLPGYYQLVPLSKTEFAAYNFMLQTSSRIRFQINKAGIVTGLGLQEDDEGEIPAKKIN